VGHSVLVLEPGDSLGNCLHTLKGVEVDVSVCCVCMPRLHLPLDSITSSFQPPRPTAPRPYHPPLSPPTITITTSTTNQYGNHTTGMLHVYEELLRAGMADKAPQPRWVRIGTEEDGFSFDVARVGAMPEMVYRMGKQALIDDQVTCAPDNRERVGGFVSKMEAVARESSGFFISRLFPPGTARFLGALLGQSYGQAGHRTVEQVLGANLPDYEELDLLRGLFRGEGLLPSEASFAAYVSAMNHTFQGMSYPVGGLRSLAEALVPTIRASGGKVFHRAQVKSIQLSSASADKGKGKQQQQQQRAVGVVLENGQVVRCRESVVSALGAVPTLAYLLPKVPLGPGLELCEEARPRFYTLVLLKGSPEELELPAQDYHQLPTNETAGGSLAWFHLSFPTAKDPEANGPYSVAVVETEADDDVLEACFRKADGSGCTTRVPAPGAGDTPGMKFYRPRPPSDAKIKRLQQNVVRRLVDLFPQLETAVETEQGIHTVGPIRAGLSHRPARFAAQGLRAAVAAGMPGGVENVFLAGSDLVLGTFTGSLLGGWLGAHAALGYGALDLLVFQRNLTGDLKNVPRPRMLGEGEEGHLEATPDGGYRRAKDE
jgi:all-trans-retinol 13,14-reductase